MNEDLHNLEAMLTQHHPVGPTKLLRERVSQSTAPMSRFWWRVQIVAAALLLVVNAVPLMNAIQKSPPPSQTVVSQDDSALQLARSINDLDLQLTPEQSEAIARQLAISNSSSASPSSHHTFLSLELRHDLPAFLD